MARLTTAILILVIFDLLIALFGLTTVDNSGTICLLKWATSPSDFSQCGLYANISFLLTATSAVILIGAFVSHAPDTALRITFIGILLPLISDMLIAFNQIKIESTPVVGSATAVLLAALFISPMMIGMYITFMDWVFGRD